MKEHGCVSHYFLPRFVNLSFKEYDFQISFCAKQKKLFPWLQQGPLKCPTVAGAHRPLCLWFSSTTPCPFAGTGSTGIQCVQSRSSHETLLPAPVHDRTLRVISSPSSLMSSHSSNDGKTAELFFGRGHSHNVLFQSSLVLLLPLGSAEERESHLALGGQHQAVCTTPGRSSVPNKENQVWSDKRKEWEQGREGQLEWDWGRDSHRDAAQIAEHSATNWKGDILV